jgi:hypothetical protein
MAYYWLFYRVAYYWLVYAVWNVLQTTHAMKECQENNKNTE